MANTIILLMVICFPVISGTKYTPDWDSLDSRPLPTWYDEAKFGIFIHWGVFSVPSFHSEWFWPLWHSGYPDIVEFMKRNYRPDFTYADFAPDFTTEFFNPTEWAKIFNASGAKYIVLISKHGEGYTNWPSNYSYSWNSQAVGPKRDLVGELSTAIRSETNIKFGTYYCLSEWLHPLYIQDRASNFTTDDFARTKAIPEIYELVKTYKPEIVWSDLADALGPASYWKSKEFLAWLYNESPVKDTVVTNDRWCKECPCKHGGYLTCRDKFNPGVLQKRKWENCMSIDTNSWGYRRNQNLEQLLSIHSIISTFAATISCGGNMLMNIGPTKDGKIVPIFEERLRQFGSWLKVNGEGIYGTKPWSSQKDNMTLNVWYTKKKTENEGTTVFAILLSWPNDEILKLSAPNPTTRTEVSMLGYGDKFKWESGPSEKGIYITIPVIPINKIPCQWAWVLKLTFIQN